MPSGTAREYTPDTMNYEIHVKQVPAQLIASERRHTALAELGSTMQSTLAKIATSVHPPDATQGVPFAIYYDKPFKPEDIDVEIGVPIAQSATLDESVRVQRRQLPGGPVAFTMHVGPYKAIGEAYTALYAWMKAHGHRPLGPPREVYIVGPRQGITSAEYRTEIDIPID